MKLKSLLFGSAAAMMVVTGAQAADLPTAEPVEYVRVCDAFGTGFFYIPGTDTCLKISGYARYEAHWVEDDADDPEFNNFTTRVRGEVQFDARTMTDMGLLRSYIALRGTIGPSDFGSDGGYGDGFNIDKAWLSLANDTGTLTAGHHGSFFDFFGGNAMNTRIGGDDPTLSTNLLAYTFAIGNGVSASISVEDNHYRRYGIGFTTTMSGTMTITATVSTGTSEGQELPDFVANIRVDQGWGSAQIMGAVGRVGSAGPVIDDEIGWAVGAGVSIGVPGTGIGLDVQGTWADGLVAYSTTGNGAGIFDAVVNAAGNLTLTESWAIQAGLTADVSPTISVGIDGTYADVDHGGLLATEDYDTWVVAGTVHWKPVSGLTISGEVAYESIDADNNAVFIADEDVWGAMMRINRTF
jgi:hypothetical protein